jgi:hypothetical protein
MPLPACNDEAGLRELEPKCADRESPAARRTVRQLREESQQYKMATMCNCTLDGLPNLVRCATEAGVSADTIFPDGELVVAATEGHTRVLQVLLDAGADCNAVDSHECSALHRAAAEGRRDCLELLLAAGAVPLKADDVGNSPLNEAVLSKRVECARLLLPLSDLGHYSRRGTTVLHDSVTAASYECFQLLLPHIPDVDVRTRAGVDENGAPLPLSTELRCTMPATLGCSTWPRLC